MFSCIIGPNLELRLHEDRFAQEMFDVSHANADHLRPWMGWIEKNKSIDDTRKHIRESLEGFANRKCVNTGIWEHNRFIGSAALHEIHWPRRYAEMGYWVIEIAQGRGIVTRAATALIDHAFNDLKLHRVEIRCDPDNTRSRAIPKRLGFREEGVLRESLERGDGVMRDMVVYGLLCHEWEEMSELRIGISGWRYEPWRGTFYPKDLPQKRELEFASRQLNSIEINGTFYSLQRPEYFEEWRDQTPDDFVFAVKGSRFLTHMKRLKDVEVPLANFFAQGLLALKEKLGPILWQLPPNFLFDAERLENFFKLLPRDFKAAAKLARQCDARVKKRSYFEVDKNRPLRHAMEIRHESFNTPAFVKLLRKHDVALVIADTAGKWPLMKEITADFVYARLHGDEELYVSGYTPKALDQWAKSVRAWKKKKLDVYVYFDNDAKVRSPFDAIGLAQRVGGFVPDKIPEEPPPGIGEEARKSWPIL